ncbi:MAG: hypothetical protein R3Y09_00085 [Clostridia bacterium]
MQKRKKEDPIVTLEKLRDELVVISQKIKRGELTPTVGNAMTNALRASIYAEQIRLSKDKGDPVAIEETSVRLSKADKARLDNVAKLLSNKEE